MGDWSWSGAMIEDMANFAVAHQRLKDLRNGLLHLHKILLESEQRTYERDISRINTRGELLELVLHDPWFAYLHDLSKMVVAIDEAVESEEPPVGEEEAKQFIASARRLVTPAEEGQGFQRRYFEALQRDPNVVIAHSDMLKAFDRINGMVA